MQNEDWHEHLGRIIGGTITCGSMSAIVGVVWGLALGFGIVTGAMWGGIIGVGIGIILFIRTLIGTRISGIAAAKSGMWAFGGLSISALVIGLVVWLICTLVGC